MKYGYLFKGYVFSPHLLSLSTQFCLNTLVSSDSPSFSAASCSWRKNFPFWLLHILSKAASHIWIFNPSGFIFIYVWKWDPIFFSTGGVRGPAPVARLACLFSLFAGPSWSQFKLEYFWILCHTPQAYWALLMPRPQFSLSRAVWILDAFGQATPTPILP